MLIDCLFILRDADSNTVPFHQVLLEDSSSFEEVKSEAAKGLDIKNMDIFYTDDEEDIIRVCNDEEVAEAFSVARVGASITFYVDAKTSPDVLAPIQDAQDVEEEHACVEEEHVCEEQSQAEPQVEKGNVVATEQDRIVELEFWRESVRKSLLEGLKIFAYKEVRSGEYPSSPEDLALVQAHLSAGLPVEVVECSVKHEKKTLHRGVVCDACDQTVTGIRYKCYNCPDYDLCEACEDTNLGLGTHDPSHIFLKIYKPAIMPHKVAPNVYNTPAECPYKGKWGRRCGRGGRFKKRREEVDAKLTSLEELCQNLAQQVAELKNAPTLASQSKEDAAADVAEVAHQVVHEDVDVEEEVQEDEIVFEDEAVEDEAVEAEEQHIEEDDAADLMKQSLAGLAPEAMIAFDCLVNMGFNDYPLIATLLRQHKGNVQNVVAELLAAK